MRKVNKNLIQTKSNPSKINQPVSLKRKHNQTIHKQPTQLNKNSQPQTPVNNQTLKGKQINKNHQ